MKFIYWLSTTLTIIVLWGGFIMLGCEGDKVLENLPKTKHLVLNQLSNAEKAIILDKGTEKPFSGEYNSEFSPGVYCCRQCNTPLYVSDDKFNAHCGWPSFDLAIPDQVEHTPDKDGIRTEITCKHCGAHLGHVFTGENLTDRNTRHCVNSISMKFIPDSSKNANRAIFAGGCFWGVQYYMEQQPGVSKVVAGYIGGQEPSPDYDTVCSGDTNYAEAAEVFFDPQKTNFESLAKIFFEIHDPTQMNRQGPDIGQQYRSAIFYVNDSQKDIAIKLIRQLQAKGLKVTTKVLPASRFWPAETYHQDWYKKKSGTPYCHGYVKRF